MYNWILIGLGSGLGGIARYEISTLVYRFTNFNFPFGTLFVNVSGSFLIGFAFIALLIQINEHSHDLRLFLMVGVLGGYTTFSSFSLEAIQLIEENKIILAALNVGLSPLLCVGAAWAGILVARSYY